MSYSLLIVEDERLEAEMLEDMIRNRYPQIPYIYSADNGIDALRLTQKKNPDIVLLDINIPGISGIEYMKALSENHFQGHVVITTAYDSFEYAKETMKYGAVGYLLKPIMDTELSEFMEKCFELVQEKRKVQQISEGMISICSYAQRYLMNDFLQGNVPERAMQNAYGWPADGKLQARMVRLCFGKELDESRQKEVVQTMESIFQPFFRTLWTIDSRELLCAFTPQEYHEAEELEVAVWCAASVLVRVLEKKAADCLIGMQITFTKVCSSYRELMEAVPGAAPFQISLNMGEQSAYDRRMKLSKAVQRMREGNAKRAVHVFHGMFEQQETWWGGVYLFLKAVLQYQEEIDVMDGLLAVDAKKPMESLAGWLQEILTQPEQKDVSIHPVIAEAVRIMEKEFGSLGLSQTTLAERLGLNPAYFSRRFKKETGQNFSTAMTQIRMCHAKELLDLGMTPEQVSVKCGYTNRKYFYETYRLYYGISATQYVQRIENNERGKNTSAEI